MKKGYVRVSENLMEISGCRNPRWFYLYCFYLASFYSNFFPLTAFVPRVQLKIKGKKNDCALLDPLTPKSRAFLICETGVPVPASLGLRRIP